MTIESFNRSSHAKGDVAEAEKHTGTKSRILRGKQEPPFGNGQTGNVTQETVRMVREKKDRQIDLVTKHFIEPVGDDSLESSISAFKLLKEAGIKHLPTTYRQVGKTEVFMTDYNHDGKVAVGGNRNEKISDLLIRSITNFHKLLQEMGKDIQRATNAEISIFTDSYFFVVPSSGGDVEVDFVVGDFGGVGKLGKFEDGTDWCVANVKRAQIALYHFIHEYVGEERGKEYGSQVEKWGSSLENTLANAAMDRGV